MSSNEFIEIRWYSGSIDEARKVSRYLVQERLVACAQIIPWIESIYMWNNQLETTQETKVVLKAKHADFDKIKSVIIENSKYEIPEIYKFCLIVKLLYFVLTLSPQEIKPPGYER